MNLNTYGDYPALAQKFLEFWRLLNEARVEAGGTALVLPDGTDVEQLSAETADLNEAIGRVDAKEEARGLAAIERDNARNVAYDSLDSFRKRVASRLKRTMFEQNLPVLPNKKDGLKDFLKPFDAAAIRWQSINDATGVPNFTPPLLLSDGTTLAQFTARGAEVTAKSDAVSRLEEQTGILRASRDALLPVMKRHFEDIRAAVIDEYPQGSVWVRTLPKLSERTTSTPEGVLIKVVFDSVLGGWKVTWKAPDELDVRRFSVRIAAGPRYKAEGEKSVGDLEPNIVEFLVREAEVPAGATVWVKVFVVNETGNEKGSNAVRLVR